MELPQVLTQHLNIIWGITINKAITQLSSHNAFWTHSRMRCMRVCYRALLWIMSRHWALFLMSRQHCFFPLFFFLALAICFTVHSCFFLRGRWVNQGWPTGEGGMLWCCCCKRSLVMKPDIHVLYSYMQRIIIVV